MVGDLNVLTDKVIYVIGNEDGIASKVYVVDNDASQSSDVAGWKVNGANSVYKQTSANGGLVKANSNSVTVAQLLTDCGATTSVAGSYTVYTQDATSGLLTPHTYTTTEAANTTVDSFLAAIAANNGTAFVIVKTTGTWTVVPSTQD